MRYVVTGGILNKPILSHYFMTKSIKNYAANCQVCGKEKLNYQLRPVKIGSLVKDVCDICNAKTSGYDDFKEAIMILKNIKMAQETDSELASPNVVVEPAEPVIAKAVQLLKRFQNNYFVGVRKIVAGTGNNFGHVETGPGKDPNTVYVNISRILNEADKEDKRESIISTALTIAHGVGHLQKFDEKTGFGTEGEAQAEENRVLQWIKSNENTLKDLFA